MNHTYKKTCLVLLILVSFISYKTFSNQNENSIMIFAPSSLKDSLTEILELYQIENKKNIKDVYLGTAQLAQQIKNGAEPDLFISANIEWMKHLEDRDLVLNKYRYTLLSNSLVAITSNENFHIKKKEYFNNIKNTFLNTKTRISLAMVDAVPAGIYAKEFFQNIGIWESIKFNVANSPNVRAALSFVSRRDLEYGVVYKSDAVADKKVKVIYNLDPSLYSKVQYPITVLNEGKGTMHLYYFLKGKKTAEIFEKWGFITKND